MVISLNDSCFKVVVVVTVVALLCCYCLVNYCANKTVISNTILIESVGHPSPKDPVNHYGTRHAGKY